MPGRHSCASSFYRQGPEAPRGEVKSPVSPSKQQCPACTQVFVAELGTTSLGLGRAPQAGLALVAPGGPLVLGLCLVIHTHSPDVNNFLQGGCCTRNLLAVLGQPSYPPSLFAEGSLDGYVHGAQSPGKRGRAWLGLEPQPSPQDQANWLEEPSQTVIMLVCPVPLPPKHSPHTGPRKRRKFL